MSARMYIWPVALGLASLTTATRSNAQEVQTPREVASTEPSAPGPVTKPSIAPDPPRSARTDFRFQAGYSWTPIDGIPDRGIDLGLTLGREGKYVGGYFLAGATFGRTTGELTSRKLRVGGGFELIFGRVRMGLELYLGYLNIDRATTAGDNFEASIFGGDLRASLDLLKFDDDVGALYIDGKLLLEAFPDSGVAWGPVVSLGLRF